jgi:hypothetical protein
MHIFNRKIVAVAVCSLALMGVAGAAGGSLAAEHPEHLVFFSMTSYGLRAFSGIEQRVATSLDAARQEGYFPYQLPAASHVQYFPNGATARLSTGGAIFAGGAQGQGMVVDIKVPAAPPASTQNRRVPDPATGEIKEMPVMCEAFPGGIWISEGNSSAQVRDALRLQRTRIHLTWVALSWQEASHQMPSSLAQLEEYQGLDRVPAAWSGINVVNSADAVDNTPMSIFAGTVPKHLLAEPGPVFLVKVNTGLGVQESGIYVDGAGATRYFGDITY